MTLLEIVILAHRCRSMHHYIAFDALQLLDGPNAADWKALLLKHHQKLLKGAKAPDTKFKDFKNHVLHVEEGEWGGARDAAMEWYGHAVDALRSQKWGDAAYALGVLTHYYADPIQPFHTAQSEEESTMHRALEWSLVKSRDTLKALIDLRGYPVVSGGPASGFVADMVLAGARYSNPHYQTVIDHYNLEAGVKDPRAGLDQRLLDIFADLLAYATSGVATLFQRAFAEAEIVPPKTDLDLPGYLAALDIPIRKLTRRIEDRKDRMQVEAMYDELQRTGKVLKTLPDDDRAIRKLHCEQVLRRPIAELDFQALEPIGSAHVPLEAHPEPVRYVLKIVPEPVAPSTPNAESTLQTETHLFEAASTVVPLVTEPAIDTEAPTEVEEPVNFVPADAVLASIEAEQAAKETSAPEAVKAEPQTEEVAAEPEEEVTVETDAEIEAEPAATTEVQATDDTEDKVIDAAAEAPAPEVAEQEAELETAEAIALPKVAEPVEETKTEKAVEAEDEPERERLSVLSPVVEAPSIGPKTASRLEQVNIHTIGDLLEANPEETASALSVRYITKKTLTDWQDQTRLMLDAPGLRVLDSQILVGAGIRSADDLAKSSAKSVLEAATNFLDTPGGARVLWGADNTVGEQEVKQWIDCAKSVRT